MSRLSLLHAFCELLFQFSPFLAQSLPRCSLGGTPPLQYPKACVLRGPTIRSSGVARGVRNWQSLYWCIGACTVQDLPNSFSGLHLQERKPDSRQPTADSAVLQEWTLNGRPLSVLHSHYANL